jgi:hypothetical protein
VDREAIETRVDELRETHPAREDFVRAIKEFNETLDVEDREVLGRVLLGKPSTGGFEVLDRRREEGGWIRRTMRKAEQHERRPPR